MDRGSSGALDHEECVPVFSLFYWLITIHLLALDHKDATAGSTVKDAQAGSTVKDPLGGSTDKERRGCGARSTNASYLFERGTQ